jgi:hypothetical protein
VERSIALAYEAVEHFPEKKVHITNELIHNPEVNDNLRNMDVQFIENFGDGKKDFESVKEGDVVILPAFGASFEEMEYFDKKVCSLSVSSSSHLLIVPISFLTLHPFGIFCRMSKLWIPLVLGYLKCGIRLTSTRSLVLPLLFTESMNTKRPLPPFPFARTISV